MRLSDLLPFIAILVIVALIALISIGIFVGFLHASGFTTVFD